MTFTPEQIALIDQMITERLSPKADQPPNNLPRHSMPEIRTAIIENLDKLKQEIGDRDFEISVLSFVLKKLVRLRKGDIEWLKGAESTRFDSQLSNVIRSDYWPGGCPFQNAGRRGWYRFNDSTTPSLFDAQ